MMRFLALLVATVAASALADAGASSSAAYGAAAAPRAIAATGLVISEFRLRGPSSSTDEFIEIYNATDSAHTVSSATSAGYAVVAADGTLRCTIPNGQVVPRRGHFLCARSSGYSLANYGGTGAAAANDTYALEIADDVGIALFSSTNPADWVLANRFDAVGSTSEPNALYREGAGYPAIGAQSLEGSFFRKVGSASGFPTDTGDNATDFLFADKQATAVAAGQHRGAPGPEALSSPVGFGRAVNTLPITLVDPAVSESASPNRFFDATPGDPSTSPQGTVWYRRTVTNNTGQPVTRLRFRIIDVSTSPKVGANADLRVMTSPSATVVIQSGVGCPCTVTVHGLSLETPPAQPDGGGFNSSLSSVVNLFSPLANGESLRINIQLGVFQSGAERLKFCAEALPDGGGCNSYPSTPTAVGVSSTSAAQTGRGVIVRWRIPRDHALLGFRVHREQGARRVLLTKRLLLAHGRFTASGYRYLDRSAPRRRSVRYWIEAVGLDGASSWYAALASVRLY